ELRRSSDLMAQRVCPFAVRARLFGSEAMQIAQHRCESEPQLELAATAIDVVGQLRDESERCLEVSDGLSCGEALPGPFGGGGEVTERARVIRTLPEMHRQLGGVFVRVRSVHSLERFADALMQALPATG